MVRLGDVFGALLSGERAFPLGDVLAFRLVALEPGRAVFELDADERHANPMGGLHGGVVSAVADSAMGTAYASLLGEGESFTTLELKVNFLRPFGTGRLVATGRVVKHGRLVGMAEADVTDEQGRLVARASSTCLTLAAEPVGEAWGPAPARPAGCSIPNPPPTG